MVEMSNKERVEAAAAAFRNVSGVHGVGFGSKTTNGKRTGEPSIIFYVDKKLPDVAIPVSERIPRRLHGLPTDVVEEARPALHDDTSKYRPLQGGCQIAEAGACNATADCGTLGCFCMDLTNNNAISLLTNNHVLINTANGGRVYQPTAECNCCNSCPNVVATKTRGEYTSSVDAAIATLQSGIAYNADIINSSGITGTYNLTDADAASGTYVITKCGRTSGLTSGILASINCVITIDGRSMSGIIKVSAQSGSVMSLKGDSGSVYLNNAMQVVGLNFGGPQDDSGSFAVGSPIADVLSVMEVELYTTSSTLIAGPGNRDPLLDRAAAMQKELEKSTTGRALVAAYHAHRDEIKRLSATDAHLIGAWRHYRGAKLYEDLTHSVERPDVPLPSIVGAHKVTKILDKLASALLRSGSSALRGDVLRLLPVLRKLPGATLDGLLAEMRNGPLEKHI